MGIVMIGDDGDDDRKYSYCCAGHVRTRYITRTYIRGFSGTRAGTMRIMPTGLPVWVQLEEFPNGP